ncbi:MAG: DUF6174 domain-containing protein [Gemmataceae bacterium]|nr:DUF6174 domain-containing protein [Gemmataceae bacterium]
MSPPNRKRSWIWYFVIVFTLAVAATVVLAVYNSRQQLKPEQLEAARKLWREKGPSDYTMKYTIRMKADDEPDVLQVKVMKGRAVDVLYNGKPEPQERLVYYSMDRLFDFIEQFQDYDSMKGQPKVYVRAIFDDQKTGGLRWYVRRVMGGRERVEITVDDLQITAPAP